MKRLILILTIAAFFVQQRASAASKPELVKGVLLAETSAVKAGTPFTVGIWLTITPGWHIYWINPGDSGLATSVRFNLPPGFEAGPVRFPVPQRLEQPGNVVNFGYENEVMLLATVTPPANLSAGESLRLVAEVKFLCCKDVCLPGSTSAELMLEAAPEAKPANEEIIQRWERQVPSAKPADVVQSRLAVMPDGHGVVRVEWTTAPTDIQFFPGPSDALLVSNVSIKTDGKVSTIAFLITRLAGLELKQSPYPIVIGYTDSKGNRSGLAIDVPWSDIPAAAHP